MSVVENSSEKVRKMTEDFWDPEFFDDRDGLKNAVNIQEKENKYKLQVLAPGFSKKDFNISIGNGVVNILAEHDSQEEESYLRREFSRSSFSGSFSLPENVSAANVKANYHGGVLTLIMKKLSKESATKKTLKVS